VFFLTRADMVPSQYRGENTNVYDARANASKALTPSSCTGTGCQGVPAAAVSFSTPSSVTFNGTGNFPPPAPTVAPTSKPKRTPVKCKRGFVSKRQKKSKKSKCVKAKNRAKKRVGKSSAKKGRK
jgi:hypothetical protein